MSTIFSLILIIFALTSILFTTTTGQFDRSLIVVLLTTNIMSLIMFILRTEKVTLLRQQYLRSSYFFLLGFTITYLQYFADISVGNTTSWFLIIDEQYLFKALLITTVALNSYIFSYNITSFNFRKRSPSLKIIFVDLKILRFVAAILLLLFFLLVDQRFLQGGYGTYERGSGGNVGFLFENLLFAIIVLNAANIRNSSVLRMSVKNVLYKFWPEILLVLIYSTAIVLSGKRDIVIFLSLALGTAILYAANKKANLKIMLPILLGGAVLMSIVGVIRQGGETSDYLNLADKSFTKNGEEFKSVFKPTWELSASGRTLTMAVKYIEETNLHTNGLFALLDTVLIFPGLKGFVMSQYNVPMIMSSSADYLTYIYLGRKADYGVGTASIADVYLDFGIIGVVVAFMLMGIATRKFDLYLNNSTETNIYLLAIAILFVAYSVFLSRSSLLYFLSRIFYIYIVIFIARKAFKLSR